MAPILTVEDLGISFGSNHVLKSVNYTLDENEILGVIGPNGAGKTVMLNILTGILKPTKGKVMFNGADITNKSVNERVRLGIGRTFQIPRAFEKMTAYENVMTGGVFGDGLSERQAGDRAVEILEMIGLSEKSMVFAGKLSLLDRKRLEIGVDRVLLLADGRDVLAGLPAEVMASEEVERIYLGVKKNHA